MEKKAPKDWAYKTFWTAVSAVLGVLIVAVADLPYWWAAVLTPIVNAAHAYVRQIVDEMSEPMVW